MATRRGEGEIWIIISASWDVVLCWLYFPCTIVLDVVSLVTAYVLWFLCMIYSPFQWSFITYNKNSHISKWKCPSPTKIFSRKFHQALVDYSNQCASASLPYPKEHSWDLHIILLNRFFNMYWSTHFYIIIIKVDIIIWWRIPIYRTNSFKFLILQPNCSHQIYPSISFLPHVLWAWYHGRDFIYMESHQFSSLKSFSSLQQILNHIKYLNCEGFHNSLQYQ